MIKALLDNGAIVVGLSKLNCEKLLAGKPITFNLKECGGADQELIICGGKDEFAIMSALTHAFDITPDTKMSDLEGDGFVPSNNH